jgi:hypothetical protein
MPTIYISRDEKMCCNCKRFTFYIPPKREDALLSWPHNMGVCELTRCPAKATKRQCGQCERKQSGKCMERGRWQDGDE